MLSFVPRGVLDEIWDLIESVSEGFFLPTLTYFFYCIKESVIRRYLVKFLLEYGE